MSFITSLALISVVLRIISRRIKRAQLWWDDYLIIIAMVVALGETVNMLVGVSFGGGDHLITLSPSDISSYLKTFWVAQILFSFSVTLIKMSILLFYRRIFPSRKTNIAIIATGCFLIAWFLAQFLSVMLSCRPIEYYWDKTIANGKCIDENVARYAITGASLLADLIIFGIPIPILWGLKKPPAQRVGLIGLFLAGALVCVAGIVRIPFLVELDVDNLTYSIVPAAIWITVETRVGIVCACLPTLLPLFRRVNQTILSRLFRLSSNHHWPPGSKNSDMAHGEPSATDPSSHRPDRSGCPNCRSVTMGDGNAESEEGGKRQRGWHTAAMSRADREVESRSQEETVVEGRKEGDLGV